MYVYMDESSTWQGGARVPPKFSLSLYILYL